MRHSEGTFTADDGLEIFHRAWLPDGDATSAVLLCHGLGEHSGRYEHVARALVDRGCAVRALDHRGHGRSGGTRVFVKRYDEFQRDLARFRAIVDREHPGVPLVVLGHSMGGNLAMGHVLDHQRGVAGLALSGAALQIPPDVPGPLRAIAGVLAKVAPGVRPQGLDASAVSRDPDVVARYLADPLVYSGKVSAGLAAALFDSIERFQRRFAELRLPLLVMHGTDDRLVPVSSSRALERAAVNADVTTHYYEGLYHEIFNEPERDEVIGDLLTWLDRVLSASAPA
jgi:acylglycerol lipase